MKLDEIDAHSEDRGTGPQPERDRAEETAGSLGTVEVGRCRCRIDLTRTVLWILVVVVILTSLRGLGSFATVDEDGLWHGGRIPRFWAALLAGDFSAEDDLMAGNAPGITQMWIAGAGYACFDFLVGSGDKFAERGWLQHVRRAFEKGAASRCDSRIPIRAAQRFSCYAACMLACYLIARMWARAVVGDVSDSNRYRKELVPFIFLILAANPVIRIYARLVVGDGLTASFGTLAAVGVYYASRCRADEEAGRWALIGSGAAMALSMLSKYNAFFILAFVLLALAVWTFAERMTKAPRTQGGAYVEAAGKTAARIGLFLTGFLLAAYVFNPYAWPRPSRLVLMGKPLLDFLSLEGVLRYGVSGVLGALALSVAINGLRGWIGRHKDALLFGGGALMATYVAIMLLAGVIWQDFGRMAFLYKEIPADFPRDGIYIWSVAHAYTYNVGRFMTYVLHQKHLFGILGTTTPLYLLACIFMAPAVLLFAGSPRMRSASKPVTYAIVFVQLLFLFQLAVYNAFLFPTYNRYMLMLYYPLALYGGLVIALVARLAKRAGPYVLCGVALCAAVVHGFVASYPQSFVNCLRSRTLENKFGYEKGACPVWPETGANLIEAARFMNQKYIEAGPEDRKRMTVAVDYAGFECFYLGPSKRIGYDQIEQEYMDYPCLLVTRTSFSKQPSLQEVLNEYTPIYTVKRQGMEFAWLYEFDGAPKPTKPTEDVNLVRDGGFESDTPDRNWLKFSPDIYTAEARHGQRCARIADVSTRDYSGCLVYGCRSGFGQKMEVSFFARPLDTREVSLSLFVLRSTGPKREGCKIIPLMWKRWQRVTTHFDLPRFPSDLQLVIRPVDARRAMEKTGTVLVDDVTIILKP